MSSMLLVKLLVVLIALTFFLIILNANIEAWALPKLETDTGEESSIWLSANKKGFGNPANLGIVDFYHHQGNLYPLGRNDGSDFDLWKTTGNGWVRVTDLAPFYYNLLTNRSNIYLLKGIRSEDIATPRTRENLRIACHKRKSY